MIVSNVKVTCNDESVTKEEIQKYINYLENKHKRKVSSLRIDVDGDYVDLKFALSTIPFERIRRITGYLVGTVEKWNDAKRAEEEDRVKHAFEMEILE